MTELTAFSKFDPIEDTMITSPEISKIVTTSELPMSQTSSESGFEALK